MGTQKHVLLFKTQRAFLVSQKENIEKHICMEKIAQQAMARPLDYFVIIYHFVVPNLQVN